MTVRLTDAPAGLDSAVVTIDRVMLRGRPDSGANEDEGAVSLMEEPRTLDLLRLQDRAQAFLADRVGVPEGTYTELRLQLGSTNYVVVNGTRSPLTRPEDRSSGIRVVVPPITVEGGEDRYDVTLDFDVEDSVHESSAGGYRLDPAVRVQAFGANGRSVPTVSVEGQVSSVDPNAGRVSVDGLVFTTTANTVFDGDGISSLAGISAGQALTLEGTIRDDGRLVVREIEVRGDEDADRSITAFVESKQDARFQILGVPMRVSSETTFDEGGGLGRLRVGDRLEVDYEFVNGTRTALSVEREGL